MELTMTNNFGFCELNENEMMAVDGGGTLGTVAGIALVLGTVALTTAICIANPPAGAAAVEFVAANAGTLVMAYDWIVN